MTKREAARRVLLVAAAIRGALGDDDEAVELWAGDLEEIALRLAGLIPRDVAS